MKNNKVKPITLETDKDLWEKFKSITPRSITLNDKIVELIEKEIKNIQSSPREDSNLLKGGNKKE